MAENKHVSTNIGLFWGIISSFVFCALMLTYAPIPKSQLTDESILSCVHCLMCAINTEGYLLLLKFTDKKIIRVFGDIR